MSFSNDQYKAASSFAYTMIVVDDEPDTRPAEAAPPAELKKPDRRNVAKEQAQEEVSKVQLSHPLDAKSLIKSSLELGLVCSVVNPIGDEKNVAKNVAKASARADIVSLDWHMKHGDNGELTSEIIKEILLADEAIGGRLRLIAIYTGNKNHAQILSTITERLNSGRFLQNEIVNQNNVLKNKSGLRLIWLEKSLGNKNLPDAISESQLPEKLLRQFSNLSEGLLSNVALATISSMRDATHHVLSKFSPELDGPFFHHRALLDNTADSMDYAISIVLSSLKSEVNKSQVSENFITTEAVKRRLCTLAGEGDIFVLRYTKDGQDKEFNFHLDEILSVIEGKHDKWPPDLVSAAKARNENANNPNPPKASYKNDFSTVFSKTKDAANKSMMHFSFLTNASSSELSSVLQQNPPKLGLGSVLYSSSTSDYLLCLQASCDSVRGDGLFFFIPLTDANGAPDVVVPFGILNNSPNYIGLSVPAKKAYTKSISLNFGPIDETIGGIQIDYNTTDEIFEVTDTDEKTYRWLANLKYKRALRISQAVSQQIYRIGFDEFEPFKS